MRHIGIVTGAHLCRNPRVVKEATALREAGNWVTVVGPAISDALSELDATIARAGGFEHEVPVDVRPSSTMRMRHRLVRRLATEVGARFGWERYEALGYGLRATLTAARRLDADFIIGHQEVGLWVANRLADAGQIVGVDLEDWYSEDLLPEARLGRPVNLLRREEVTALRRGGHVTTTSAALASALFQASGGEEPDVVYNAFPWSDRERLDGKVLDRIDPHRPSLHWVSQTVGPGRGLETLFEALGEVSVAVEVHLRGACTGEEDNRLRALFPEAQGHRLLIHPLVPASELLSRIAEHDMGLALELPDPPNRQYTVTNKILHYLLGGLAVVATDTRGQREIAAKAPEAVDLCRSDDPASLAESIRRVLASPDTLARAKRAALQAARDSLCWERQAPILTASVEQAIRRSARL